MMRAMDPGSASSRAAFEPAISEMSSSSSSEQLSPQTDDVAQPCDIENLPAKTKEGNTTNSKTWLPVSANQLLGKLANMKVFAKSKWAAGAGLNCDAISKNQRAEGKQEINGHYGVDG